MESKDVKKNFQEELEPTVAEANRVADAVGLDDAIVLLLSLEKKCRVNNDFTTLKGVCVAIIQLCFQKKDWARINSSLQIINKRRAQSKHAIAAIVTEAMTYLDSTPSEEEKVALITTLKDVCEAKIYVEGESARLHLMLAMIYEANGNIVKACEEIQDVHVETYGSLSREEKADYILHQVRLNLVNNDFVRACIHSRKMNRKMLEEADFAMTKKRFFELMVEYHFHEREILEVAKSFQKLMEAELTLHPMTSMGSFESVVISSLEATILFSILSPHTSERLEILKSLKSSQSRLMSASSMALDLIGLFTSKELIPLDFPLKETFLNHSIFPLICKGSDDRVLIQSLLALRIVEHNLLIVASFYSRITLPRLSELCEVTTDELEDHLSRMSQEGLLDVKIDRPRGIVVLQSLDQQSMVLDKWSKDVQDVLKLVETTCHLIRREMVVHRL